jgi:hypothetical protein
MADAEDQVSVLPGDTFERPQGGHYRVTDTKNNRIQYHLILPDGTVKPPVWVPISVFQRGAGRRPIVEPPTAAKPAEQPDRPAERSEKRTEEFSAEEIAEFQRLDQLYRRLPKGDRWYIVDRWDQEQGLESPNERLNYRRDTPRRLRRRNFWYIAALIAGALFAVWLGNLMDRDHKRRSEDSYLLDSLREHAKNNQALKSAIDEVDREYQELIESRDER